HLVLFDLRASPAAVLRHGDGRLSAGQGRRHQQAGAFGGMLRAAAADPGADDAADRGGGRDAPRRARRRHHPPRASSLHGLPRRAAGGDGDGDLMHARHAAQRRRVTIGVSMQCEVTEIDGEKALLIRRGDETFTIGATCTHYNGPLEEGIIVGDTIRCPWHHACFDLRTGEAVRAPALAPIKVFGVGAAAPGRPAAEAGAATLRSVAIVGAGAAGAACADMLRRRGYAGAIVMYGTEAPVDRPNLSKDYLAGHAPEEWLPLPVAENVELQMQRVTALDAKSKTLTLDDGSTRAFDAILLATGADPVRLPIAGADKPNVHFLRTAADSRKIIALAEKGKRACIIAAGFSGLEVAASPPAREVEVDVLAPEA